MAMPVSMILVMYVILCILSYDFNKLTMLYIHVHISISMTNKCGLIFFLSIKYLSVCLVRGKGEGENLSPMLFSIFVNDLEKYLIENDCEQLSFNDVEIANFLKITVLLYDDDTIVFADSAKGLQKTLNSLNQYCEEWKLIVNEKKKTF